MKLATLLPTGAVAHLGTIAGHEPFLHAQSWSELESVLTTQAITLVLIDPTAAAETDTNTASEVFAKYPSIPFLAYVSPSPENLRPIAKLSKNGLAGVILHPVAAHTLWSTVGKASVNPLVRETVGAFEASLATLSPVLLAAIRDLFQRPYRYSSATDIALEARSTPAKVRRNLKSAHLGPPRKLLVMAKLLDAYNHLRHANLTVDQVSQRLGYSSQSILARHSQSVFGCSPSRLRQCADRDEIVASLLEWFYKPSRTLL